MKFELVEFYEACAFMKKKRGKKFLGTVHIYACDCELDLRGIHVTSQPKGVFFHVPFCFGVDLETGEETRYPFFRFNNEKTHKEMIDFLNEHVQPKILEYFKNKPKPTKDLGEK